MIIQQEFPFGNPTNENKMIAAIVFITITLLTAAEFIKLYKDKKVNVHKIE
jgi:hypothetical protein